MHPTHAGMWFNLPVAPRRYTAARFDLCTEILSWRRSKIEKGSRTQPPCVCRVIANVPIIGDEHFAAEKLSPSTKCPGYHPAINFSSEARKFIKSARQWRDSVRYSAAGIFHRFTLLSLFKATILRLR